MLTLCSFFFQHVDIAENPVVVIVVSIVFFIFSISLLISWWIQRNQQPCHDEVPICSKNEPYKYDITIVTGRHWGAGNYQTFKL